MEDAAGRSIRNELPIDANEPRGGVAAGMGGERIDPILLEDRPAAVDVAVAEPRAAW